MLNIQTMIEKKFQENISYLKQEHYELFKQLSEYEMAVEKELYTPKYEIIYENKSFDVKEINSLSTLYNKELQKYTQLAVESIETSTRMDTFTSISTTNDPIFSLIQEKGKQDTDLKKLFKFVFFGVGLSTHIVSTVEKYSLTSVLLVEDDIELFRLSLFVTNYATLAKKCKLYFSVFQERDDFLSISENFLANQHYYNAYIKFFTMLNHSDTKVKEFQLAVSTQAHLTFLHQDLLTQFLQPTKNIVHNYMFLTKDSSLEHISIPFILVAPGPSLEKDIALLLKNQNNFVVVAVSATLSYLESKNIRVDITIHLDAFEAAYIHFEKIKDKNYFKNTLAFFSAKTSSHILNYFTKKNIYLFEDGTYYKKSSLKPSAPCVGSISYQILLLLKVKKLFLLGLDLSVDRDSGKTHSAQHSYSQTLNIDNNIYDEHSIDYKASLFQVVGNKENFVLTTPHFFYSIGAINLTSNYFKKSEVYNLSNGAKFENIPNALFPSFSSLNPEKILTLKGELFTKEDIKNLSTKYIEIKQILLLLKHQRKNDKLNTERFLAKLIEIDKEFSNEIKLKNLEIYKVINLYLQTILPYIFNYCNRDNEQQDEKKLEQIETLLFQQIKDKINTYLKTIETII